jgi:hypothetical protein
VYWISTILESNDAQVFATTAYIYSKQLVLIGLIFFKNLCQRLHTATEKAGKRFYKFHFYLPVCRFPAQQEKGKVFRDLTSTPRA